ncbi:MAG: RluA family pseudouridine synthase [Eudoraea sp.]|nr:RluA family pseudouridine synthase [Eudoraea sp.]
MGNSHTHLVPLSTPPERIQEYGVGLFKAIPTKSALKKALKKKQIQVNGTVAATSTMIEGGETIIYTPLENSGSDKRLNLKLKVLFEDDYLAAIYKPAGILVSGNIFKTIANGLSQNLLKSEQADAVTPHPVHRLDYATTGVLLVGKTSESIRRLNKLFEDRDLQKTYYALTIGTMESQGIIKEPITNKKAITCFVLEATVDSPRFKYLNLVKLTPQTGRRHQLRIHLAGLGNPILGDKEYTPDPLILKGKGMYLHAASLEFTHPFTGKIHSIQAPLPERFTRIFNRPYWSCAYEV